MNSKILNLVLVFALGAMVFLWFQVEQERKQLKKAYQVKEKFLEEQIDSLEGVFETLNDTLEARDQVIAGFAEERQGYLEEIENAKTEENETKSTISSYDSSRLAQYFADRRKRRER